MLIEQNSEQAKASPSLDRETRTTIDTATAAFYFSRKPRTLNKWAVCGSGPLQPIRVNGRLAWNVAEIRKILAGGSQ